LTLKIDFKIQILALFDIINKVTSRQKLGIIFKKLSVSKFEVNTKCLFDIEKLTLKFRFWPFLTAFGSFLLSLLRVLKLVKTTILIFKSKYTIKSQGPVRHIVSSFYSQIQPSLMPSRQKFGIISENNVFQKLKS
jgi:hypothetical protein